MRDKNLATLFESRVYRNAAAPALRFRNGQTPVTWSWQELADRVREAGKGLLALGVSPGTPVGIVADPRPEVSLLHIATVSMNAVSVLLPPDLPEAEMLAEIEGIGITLLFISGADPRMTALETNRPAPLRTVISMDETWQRPPHLPSLSWKEFREKAKPVRRRDFFDRLESTGPDAPASVAIWRNGKGKTDRLRTTHGDLLKSVVRAQEQLTLSGGDSLVPFLPLSHPWEQFSFWAAIDGGAQRVLEGTNPFSAMEAVGPSVLLWTDETAHSFYDLLRSETSRRSSLFRYLYRQATETTGADSKPGVISSVILKQVRKKFGPRFRLLAVTGRTGDAKSFDLLRRVGFSIREVEEPSTS